MATLCDRCGAELQVGDFPFCPHGRGANSVIQDSIEGGIEIRNGLCNEDGSPRRYYSKSAIAAEAKRRGLTNHDTHIGAPGSDKSKFTTRWI